MLSGIFKQTWVKHHGLPKIIIADRDPRYIWTIFGKLYLVLYLTVPLGTELKFSTAFHPQTDGQSERANRTLEEVSRRVPHLGHFVVWRSDELYTLPHTFNIICDYVLVVLLKLVPSECLCDGIHCSEFWDTSRWCSWDLGHPGLSRSGA
jgi:hypothetical protein